MSASKSVIKKARKARPKRGRPRTGIGRLIGVRIHPELEERIDEWRDRQPAPRPTKPAAIRALLAQALDASENGPRG